jgi:transcriptional regulator with XRE-family HTH domain
MIDDAGNVVTSGAGLHRLDGTGARAAGAAVVDASDDDVTSVARLYYLDGLGQQEIAGMIGVSRSTVSRLLTAARERGIVRISVDLYDPRDAALERRLSDRFQLRHAVVIRTPGRTAETVRRAVGYYAAPDRRLVSPAAVPCTNWSTPSPPVIHRPNRAWCS